MNETSIETTKDIHSLGIEMEASFNKIWQADAIINHISFMLNISFEDIVGVKRNRNIVEARHIAIFLIKQEFPEEDDYYHTSEGLLSFSDGVFQAKIDNDYIEFAEWIKDNDGKIGIGQVGNKNSFIYQGCVVTIEELYIKFKEESKF